MKVAARFSGEMTMKILFLDTDFELQQEVREKLYHKGYTVSFVENLEEAEEALKESGFDIFICDYNLQVVDRLSQLPRIYNEHPYLDILLTSMMQQSFVPNDVRICAVDCFEKPFPIHMLVQTLMALEHQKEIAYAA